MATEEEFLKQYNAAPDSPVVVEVPPIEVTPEKVSEDEFLARFNKAKPPGAKIKLDQYKYGPIAGAAIRGAAGAPGAVPDVLNFLADVPGLATKGAGWIFDDPELSQLGNDLITGVPEIPGGSADWQKWLGAPEEGIDYPLGDPGIERYFQKGVELGTGSAGFGLGSLPERIMGTKFAPEFLLPKDSPLAAQLSQDVTTGLTGGMGQAYGEAAGGEESGATMGTIGGLAGAMAPLTAIKGARVASDVLGVREPAKFSEGPLMWLFDKFVSPGGEQEARGRLMENFDRLHPNARERLINEMRRAELRAGSRFPDIDFTPGMLTDDPALDMLLGPAYRSSPTMIREAEDRARQQLNREWGLTNPDADPTFPRALVSQRVGNTIEAVADRRRAAESARIQAEADAQALADKNAGVTSGHAAETLSSEIARQAEAAKQAFGAEIERVKGAGIEIPGTDLESWRKRVIAAADAEGQASELPSFLDPKGGGLNEALYPTTTDGVKPAPGARAKTVEVPTIDSLTNQPSLIHTQKVSVAPTPQNIDIRKLIGWDQILRDQETAAYKAGESRKAHWAKQARKELSTVIENALGSTEYADAKKAYLEGVVKRFYTPTIDPLLSPGAKAEKAGAAVMNNGVQAVREVLQAVGDDPAAGQAFVDYAMRDFVSAAYKDGKINQASANAWMNRHKDAIAELQIQAQQGNPAAAALASQIIDGIDNVLTDQAAARSALDKALAAEKAAGSREKSWSKSLQRKSAARFFLNKDPEATVREIIGSKNLSEDAKSVTRLLSKDPDALAGFHQAIYDDLYNKASSLANSATRDNLQGIAAQLTHELKPYLQLEQAGALPQGTVKRVRQLIAAQYSIERSAKARQAGADVRQISGAEQDISQIARGLFGSRSGNLITATVRDLFKTAEDDLVYKVLRDAALYPKKMMELLQAQQRGKTHLGKIFARQAAMLGNEEADNGAR